MHLQRALTSLLCLALLAPPLAAAAVEPGSYAGKSSAKVQNYREENPRTDRGKVSFKVKPGKVLNLKVKGQQASCGGQTPERDFTIEKIKLDDGGKGKATHTDPVLGKTTFTIRVTGRGTATGTMRFGGLCEGSGKFSAKRT
jgi:hypothetical protein